MLALFVYVKNTLKLKKTRDEYIGDIIINGTHSVRIQNDIAAIGVTGEELEK